MIKKTITYTDYNGVVRTEDFYFNLTKAEVVEIETEVPGGLTEYLKKIAAEQDPGKLVEKFKWFILRTVGVKSPDGKRFVKSQEVRDAFEQTEAYSELFMELAQDADAAAKFINGVIPNVPKE